MSALEPELDVIRIQMDDHQLMCDSSHSSCDRISRSLSKMITATMMLLEDHQDRCSNCQMGEPCNTMAALKEALT